MEEQPVTIRIYPGDLRPVYYTSVLAFHSTQTVEVIRLSLERLQIYEDKTLYELYEGKVNEDKDEWTKLDEGDCPVAMQEKWKHKQQEMRFFLKRKEHASLVLSEIVSQYISSEVNEGRVQDMCELEEFSEQYMLSNLRARFCNKDIYTYVGSILISINPYYFYSIYNPKYTSMYQGKELGSLPPHIFAIADGSYHTMLSERQNQSVIISGESGAGKTESTKFLLHHLMSLSAKLDESQSLELITLGTGPVLEAFGNARTVANNNSSRFGKFILVQFKENGAYHGASIEKYLLEKSRIVSQAPEERNYHVFYYLLVGAEPELKKKLRLLDIDQYNYLTQGSSIAPDNGVEEYHRLRQSLSMLRFDSDVQMGMFTVLSAILQLGNITIERRENEETETAWIKNMEAVEVIASLLQVDEQTLRSALTTRKSKAGGTDSFVTPYRVEQAIAARDSMAKALYGALFDWIVDKVNITLSAEGAKIPHKGNSIGVLDIFGFEVFQKNSFEQFCINYANEQLQQYFNKHIFKLEQAEYIAEGIEWSSVNFVDNQECLDLIAKKPTGLLPLLDEECSFPGADDDSLYLKFERQHKHNMYYHSPQLKLKDPQFTITHYASDVTYSIKGFREKNRDLMRQDIVDVLKTSRMNLVRALIGQPPFAVHCWRMANLKVTAAFAFRKAGLDHKTRKDQQSVSFKLLVAPTSSSPRIDRTQSLLQNRSRGYSVELSPQVVSEDKDSTDAFPIEHGQLRTGMGLRPSRSYDMLTKEKLEAAAEDMLSSSMGKMKSLPYASPKVSRRIMVNQKSPPPPVMDKSATLPSTTSSKHKSKSSKSTPKGEEKERRPSFTRKSSNEKPKRKLSFSRKHDKKEDGRSRLPSISKMHDKLRRRLSRNFKNKETVEVKQRPSDQYWSSAPRVKLFESASDTKLYSLGRSSSMRHGPPKTVSGQFQASLISLMERLEETNPFFVRCIKSNGEKAPCKFDDELVLRQLRYTGMMETIKIRKAGYSVRTDFEAFYEKYQFLIGPKSDDVAGQIKRFLHDLGFSSEDFQIGHSKVFMREKQKQALQFELGEKVLARIIKIQRWVRAKMLRCRFLHLRRNAIIIQCAVRSWVARKRVDAIRRKICSAVLIQSAWRRYVARKQLVLLRKATVVLQAMWRGRAARLTYRAMVEAEKKRLVEEERQRREEEERRLAEEAERKREEERRRLEEEERRRREEERAREEEERRRREEERIREEEAARMREEEEERKRLEELKELQKMEEEEREARELADEITKLADEQLELLKLQEEDAEKELNSVTSDSNILDQDVKDTLFQFDTIVSALEAEALVEQTPSPNVRTRTPSPNPQIPLSDVPHIPSSRSNSTSLESSLEVTKISTAATEEQESQETENRTQSGDDSILSNGLSKGEEDFPKEEDLPVQHSELTILRNEAKVEALKRRFSSPPQTSSSTSSSSLKNSRFQPSGVKTEQSRSSSNVKSLIAQMSLVESEKSASPPPSPLDVDLAVIRNSRLITSKIFPDFTQTASEDDAESGRTRSYTPPAIRRKVVSPFLQQEKEEQKEERDGKSPEMAGLIEERSKVKGEEGISLESVKAKKEVFEKEEKKSSEEKKGKKPLDLIRISLEEGKEEVTKKEEEESIQKERDGEAVSPRTEMQSDESLFKGDTKREVKSSGEASPNSLTAEDEVESARDSEATDPVVFRRNRDPSSKGLFKMDHKRLSSLLLSEGSTAESEESEDQESKHSKTPPPHEAEQRTPSKQTKANSVEENGTPQHLVLDRTSSSPRNIWDNDDDHLVPIILPYIPPSKKKSSSPNQKSKKEKKTSALSPDDVHLSFEERNKDQNRTWSSREMPITSSEQTRTWSSHDSSSSSSSRVGLVIGLKENGVLSSPQLIETEEKQQHPLMESKSHQYDHLRKRSDYDHLSPLEQPPLYRGHRLRSNSDMAAHRIRKQDQFLSSEVVPRYTSGELNYNSLEQRKRSALSLVDPMEVLKRRGPSSLEESTELTRCLTPEEIMTLNQQQSDFSPSERHRLFSFPKKKHHLKLPFSKSRGKHEKDPRGKLLSPDKEVQGVGHKHSSPTVSKAPLMERSHSSRKTKYPAALAHNYTQTTASKFGVYTCGTCHKGFTGFMKQALKCVDCNIMVHRHCEERAPPCKAHIESGSYVTMSRKKIISKAEDLDDLGRFLLEKIAVLVRDSSHTSLVDKVFKHSLKEFHTFLISTYSLSLQSSVESNSEKDSQSGGTTQEPPINLTLHQLVSNFDNIFRGIAKREGLNAPGHISIGVNQIKTFLDEFGKSRRTKKYSSKINPSALRRQTSSERVIQPKLHKGHKFLPRDFKVTTVCEHCSKAIRLLERGEVCDVCGYTCHEACYKKVHKKCEGKGRFKSIPEYQPNKKEASTQFGVSLQDLVPPNSAKKIPPILEKCFHHIEANGLYTQGVYRKSAGVSSKKAVRTALEDDPENADLEPYSVHAVAAAVGGFFRELPEPLLTRDMYLDFLRTMDLTNKKERQETLHKLISYLPEINHAIFERLIFHLARISQHEHINKMGPCNLAIIFAPCILQGKEDRNPEEILKDLQKQTECLEAIIVEQVEKLTATIRGIRTLTSFAREKEKELSALINQFENADSASSTLSSQKGSQPTTPKPRAERSGLTDEEKKRLTCTLEEIERERVELAVNLPKLEPFIAMGEDDEEDEGDEETQGFGNWTTPTPSPSSISPLTSSTFTRSHRAFSPITESSEQPLERPHKEASPLSKVQLQTPTTPTILLNQQNMEEKDEEAVFPPFSIGVQLISLTKDRVSKRPAIRPPSNTHRREAARKNTEMGVFTFLENFSDSSRDAPGYKEGHSSEVESDDEDLLFFETTV